MKDDRVTTDYRMNDYPTLPHRRNLGSSEFQDI